MCIHVVQVTNLVNNGYDIGFIMCSDVARYNASTRLIGAFHIKVQGVCDVTFLPQIYVFLPRQLKTQVILHLQETRDIASPKWTRYIYKSYERDTPYKTTLEKVKIAKVLGREPRGHSEKKGKGACNFPDGDGVA